MFLFQYFVKIRCIVKHDYVYCVKIPILAGKWIETW